MIRAPKSSNNIFEIKFKFRNKKKKALYVAGGVNNAHPITLLNW